MANRTTISEKDKNIVRLMAMAEIMTDKELSTLVKLSEIIQARPDLRQFAESWTGKTTDLPEVLAAM